MSSSAPNDDLLRQQVEALNVTLIAVDTRLQDLITKDEAYKRFPTKEENSRIRRRVTFTILTSVLAAFLLSMLGNNFAVNRCFLRSHAAHNTVCNTLFPGYNNAVDDSNDRLAKFNDLLTEIPLNRQTNQAQQKQLDEITRVLNELAKKNNITPITTK